VAIYDLFSKRQKRLRGEVPDVLVYDSLPKPLRVQILTILREALGDASDRVSGEVWESLHDTLARESGLERLIDEESKHDGIQTFFRITKDTERALDFIELAFRQVDGIARLYRFTSQVQQRISPDNAIAELNGRFHEHGVGYQFESGEVIRVDSTLLHAEVVKPALTLLHDALYAGANTEYLNAYEHYRHGRNEEALTECLKAFESVLKVICEKRGWDYDEKATASGLLRVVFEKGLVPSYLQTEFTSLRTSLESGVPTVRNRQGGHGRGTKLRDVPDYLVSYLLHLTATDILLLVNAERAMK
jgi:hypothetical protein